MRAIVQDAYGSREVLLPAEIDAPGPAEDEVLVRMRAASLHPDVWHVMTGRPWLLRLMGSGYRKPKVRVPGTDLAGVVEAVGARVTRFRAGDEVFGETLTGIQWVNGGAYAELVAVKEAYLARKPEGVTFEQAAVVPTAGLIVLGNLATIPATTPGARVLVNGAGGGVGAIALQVLKARGAHVTAVDSAEKQDLLRTLGAAVALDYAVHDFTRGEARYDLIFDIPGNHPYGVCRRVLTPEGKYVIIGHDRFGHSGSGPFGLVPSMLALTLRGAFDRHLPRASFAMPDKVPLMEELRALLEKGALTPVVAKAFPLAEAQEAMRHLEEGLCVGRIVLTAGA